MLDRHAEMYRREERGAGSGNSRRYEDRRVRPRRAITSDLPPDAGTAVNLQKALGHTADIAGGADVAGRDPGPPRIGPIRGGPPVRHRTRRSPCAGRHARSPAAPSIL